MATRSILPSSSASARFSPDKARASGKPDAVIEKIVDSGIKTFFKEVTLVDQPFVHDSAKTVGPGV